MQIKELQNFTGIYFMVKCHYNRTIYIFLKYKYHNGQNLLIHLYRGILKTLRVKTYKFLPVDKVWNYIEVMNVIFMAFNHEVHSILPKILNTCHVNFD